MNRLSEAQLVQLNILIYQMSGVYPDGMTVRQLAQEMMSNQVKIEKYSANESNLFFQSICDDERLGSYYIQQFSQRNGARIACFTDELFLPTDVNVIFRGTGNADEWRDNGEGGYLADTEYQKAAAEYIKQLPTHFGNLITVSGHSKGGNKAQYVTVTTNRIERCISFDGQGFSKQFLKKYANEIKAKQDRIYSISAANDYVNILFYPIASSLTYIETKTFSNFSDYHYPEILLTNRKLGPSTVQNKDLKVISEYTQWLQETNLISKQDKQLIYLNLTNLIAKRGKKLSAIAWLDTVISLADLSLGYFDNFIADKMSNNNSKTKYLFAFISRLLDYRPVKYQILRQLYDTFKVKQVNTTANLKKEIVNFQSKRNYDTQLIRLDTVEMRNSASKLRYISARIMQLYYDEQTLLRQMSRDQAAIEIFTTSIDYHASSELNAITNYLIETATNFDKIERMIEGG